MYRRNVKISETTIALNALGQRTRFEILRLLLKHDPEGLSAGEVACALSTAQNTLSSHLAKLSQAGLVHFKKRSRFRIYRADRERLSEVLAEVSSELLEVEPNVRGCMS